VLLNDSVERCALLTDEISTSGAADLGVEEERELVETAKTIAFVEFAVLRQQLGSFHVVLDLRLDSPVIYTHAERHVTAIILCTFYFQYHLYGFR